MTRNNLDDTIAAISTPIGQGGIGLVRISGRCALKIAGKIFQARDNSDPSTYKTHTVHYGWIVRSKKAVSSHLAAKNKNQRHKIPCSNEIIEEVLLTLMRAPRSYTREDIIEINCHSGIVVLREVLDLVLASGARLAEPGEFTKRAFLNGRIDLSQAEAVLDIINAKTNLSLRTGVKQLRGSLSAEIGKIKKKLLGILVTLEANIDFPEEEAGIVSRKRMLKGLGDILEKANILLGSSNHGRILREGISAVIAGRPNVGKSSLLNALLKEERAIVTPIAGTTRDTIEEIIDLEGIPLKIADTAGIIEPKDLIERAAVRRSRRYFRKANLILLTFDSSLSLTKDDWLLIKRAKGRQAIAVLNKSDLRPRIEENRLRGVFSHLVKVSSLKLTGLRELERKIVDLVWGGGVEASCEAILTSARQTQNMRRFSQALTRAEASLRNNLPVELIVEDLNTAIETLGLITGETASLDVLEEIFAKFCIGK